MFKRFAPWLMLASLFACSVQTEQLEGLEGPDGPPGADGAPGDVGPRGPNGMDGTTPWVASEPGIHYLGGGVAIGTEDPGTPFHIANAGPFQVRLEDTVNMSTWEIRQRGATGMAISEDGSGVNELQVDSGGAVALSCVNAVTDDFTVCDGDTRSSMNAGEMTFAVTSSRTMKENLRPLRVDDILEKVSRIAAYHYDFKDGPKNRIGLMAEDFHEVFGRGSDKELSGHEMQLAMWLALQALAKKTRRLDALEKRIAALETK